MKMTDCQDVVMYIPGNTVVYDCVVKNESGEYFGKYSGKKLSELETSQPGIKVVTWEEAISRIAAVNAERFSGVKEVDADRFNEMLEVLPPLSYGTVNGATTFLMGEAISGTWYSCFVSVNGKYYEGHSNAISETKEQRVARFLEAMKA